MNATRASMVIGSRIDEYNRAPARLTLARLGDDSEQGRILAQPHRPLDHACRRIGTRHVNLQHCCFRTGPLHGRDRAASDRAVSEGIPSGDPKNSDSIPDPTSPATVESARLDWSKLTKAKHEDWLDLYQRLLAIRQRDIVPLIPDIRLGTCSKLESGVAFAVDWALAEGSVLHLIANLADEPTRLVGRTAGRLIYATHPNIRATVTKNELAPWSVTWLLERGVIGG